MKSLIPKRSRVYDVARVTDKDVNDLYQIALRLLSNKNLDKLNRDLHKLKREKAHPFVPFCAITGALMNGVVFG